MYKIEINGYEHEIADDCTLLEYLRDKMGLMAAKDGCGEGACGACTVLIDGKASRACIQKISRIEGKKILTVEGLSALEKDIYAWAFAAAGAVQCGFCIPGMVMSAKGLIDVNPNPSDSEIKIALKGNLCRCTGYVKIEKAVKLAAEALRNPDFTLPPDPFARAYKLGDRMPRLDAREKVLGTGQYSEDVTMPGMLYGSALRPKTARERIISIDTGAAKAHPGVVAVLTAEDVPGERYLGHIIHDWPVMIAVGETTRYVGDALALVAATSKKALKEALALIKVESEVLKPICTIEEALEPDAPRIHPFGNVLSVNTSVLRGDVDMALAESAHVVHQTYFSPVGEHAFLEPETAFAYFDKDKDLLFLRTGSQSIYDELHEVTRMLGCPQEKVRIISALVGGGFGGKEDMSVQHHAALLAWHTKRPVRVKLSRQESLNVHPKRHPMFMDYTVGCDSEGRITAMRIRIKGDTGAYTSLGGPVMQRACTHATGPYKVPNVDIDGRNIYTNNPPSGAFRGFGVTQSAFAVELTLNLLAEKVGISYWDIRDRNVAEPGDVLGNGQIAGKDTAVRECLHAVKPYFDSSPFSGIACAWKNSGLGVGVPDAGRARLEVHGDKIRLFTSAACMGQGVATTMTQIASHITGLPINRIEMNVPDTFLTPDSGTSTASRQTLFTGEAIRRVCDKFMDDLKEADGDIFKLDGREYRDEFLYVTDPMGSYKPNPVSHAAYSYAAHVCILNEEGRVESYVACHDVGQPINLNSIEGQIEGGVVMGLGYALTEDLRIENGIPKAKLGSLGMFRAPDVPPITSIVLDCKDPEGAGAFGAKGIGEIVLIPPAAAIALAYRRWNGIFQSSLPLKGTPYSRA